MTERSKGMLGTELFTILKNRIIRWEYTPGHRFIEEELCKEFTVSRSPVREALRMLEEHELVDKVPYRGCTVKQPNFKEFYELYDLRIALETFVVEQLASRGMSEQQIEQLARPWHAFADVHSYEQVEGLELVQADIQFHETLALLTENKALYDLLCSINERLRFIRMTDITNLERLQTTCRQHLEILDRIAQRDLAGARAAIGANIQGAKDHVKTAAQEFITHMYLKS